MSTGLARCSWSDNFCKETGRKLSFARALANIAWAEAFTKLERTAFWAAYHGRPGGLLGRVEA